jgi:hypothetical protein
LDRKEFLKYCVIDPLASVVNLIAVALMASDTGLHNTLPFWYFHLPFNNSLA